MIEIAAAVIGVVLTAFITVKIAGYRNLITYEITSILSEVSVSNGRIIPSDRSLDRASAKIFSFNVKLVNRGWKNLHDVKVHAGENFVPFSIEKSASTISPATITLGKRGESFEVSIDFLPAKEEVSISFSSIGRWNDLHKFTGAGANYRLESIHYYTGYLGVLNFLKSLLVYAALGAFGSLVVASLVEGKIDHNVQSPQTHPVSRR